MLKTLLKETGIKNLFITNSIKNGAPEYNYYLKNKHLKNIKIRLPGVHNIKKMQKD